MEYTQEYKTYTYVLLMLQMRVNSLAPRAYTVYTYIARSIQSNEAIVLTVCR